MNEPEINLTKTITSPMDCDVCRAQSAALAIMNICDAVPEFDIPIWDDYIAALYDTADNLCHSLEHHHEAK